MASAASAAGPAEGVGADDLVVDVAVRLHGHGLADAFDRVEATLALTEHARARTERTAGPLVGLGDAGDGDLPIGSAVAHLLPTCDWAALARDAAADGAEDLADLLSLLARHRRAERDAASWPFSRPGPVVYLERVRLHPRWRGAGLSLVFVRRLIATIGRGYSGALLVPAPTEDDRSRRSPASRGRHLAAHWARLGFAQATDGIWTLDLTGRPAGRPQENHP